jgi:hypothetical protein
MTLTAFIVEMLGKPCCLPPLQAALTISMSVEKVELMTI